VISVPGAPLAGMLSARSVAVVMGLAWIATLGSIFSIR
jgi:hypothetical protein